MSKQNEKKTQPRGTNDEFKILGEIVKADQFLLDRVLTKIREVRASNSQNLSDIVAEKKGAKKAEDRAKGSGT